MSFLKLLQGHKNFYKRYFKSGSSLYEDLIRNGQTPDTLIIACSDSRADPAILTNSQPGEMFVVRNVAAIVPPYKSDSQHHGTSAAIEFAVRTLKVKHIVVMGHSLCGGVHALSQKEHIQHQYEFLTPWISIGDPALKSVEEKMPNASPEEKRAALERAVTLVSLNNLMTFPWIAEGVKSGTISLHGWYFDMTTGKLLNYNPKTDAFEDIRFSKKIEAPE